MECEIQVKRKEIWRNIIQRIISREGVTRPAKRWGLEWGRRHHKCFRWTPPLYKPLCVVPKIVNFSGPPFHPRWPGHWDTGTLGHRDTGTPGHRDTGTQGHWDTGTPGHRDTGIPGYWDTGIQDTRTLGHLDNGWVQVPSYSIVLWFFTFMRPPSPLLVSPTR